MCEKPARYVDKTVRRQSLDVKTVVIVHRFTLIICRVRNKAQMAVHIPHVLTI